MNSHKTIEYLTPEIGRNFPDKILKDPPILKWVRIGFQTIGRLFPPLAARLVYRLFSTPRVRARHRRSNKVLEKARLFEVMYGRRILKAYDWGSGNKIVLLVHGWESRGTALGSFVPKLVRKGYRVVAFDGPAHGDSGGKSTNLPHFAGAVRAIINHLDGVHSVIAHSFGGASTVFAMGYLDPEIQLQKLVLIGVPARLEAVVEDTAKYLNLPKSVERSFYKFLENKFENEIKHSELADSGHLVKVDDVLVIHDRQDGIVPFESAELIYKKWEQASLLVSDGYGHFLLKKNPDVITRVVEFIDKKTKAFPTEE